MNPIEEREDDGKDDGKERSGSKRKPKPSGSAAAATAAAAVVTPPPADDAGTAAVPGAAAPKRQRPNQLTPARPLSFGGGVHYCVGAQLASIEAEVAIATLLRRLPTLQLDNSERPDWRRTFVLRGLNKLSASW